MVSFEQIAWRILTIDLTSFFNGPTSSSFCLFSVFFKKTERILQQINVKNVHSASGAGIQTHNLLIKSLLP